MTESRVYLRDAQSGKLVDASLFDEVTAEHRVASASVHDAAGAAPLRFAADFNRGANDEMRRTLLEELDRTQT